MATFAKTRCIRRLPKAIRWLPLVGLPIATTLLCADWPAWVFMWSLAASLYAGLKWLTFAECRATRQASWNRSLGYLFLWAGMDATTFFDRTKVRRPAFAEWLQASAKTVFGLFLLFVGARLAASWHGLAAAWAGIAGIVFVLHFGLFHLLSLGWRRAGVHAQAIMNLPILASSLSDFWSRRWNLAFRDLAHAYVFRALVRSQGPAKAMLAVFLVSGLLHDLVISLPARGGWGLPTVYFLIQGFGVLLERTRLGKRLGLGRGIAGRLFAAAVIAAPVLLLFHMPFANHVVLPMLDAIGAI